MLETYWIAVTGVEVGSWLAGSSYSLKTSQCVVEPLATGSKINRQVIAPRSQLTWSDINLNLRNCKDGGMCDPKGQKNSDWLHLTTDFSLKSTSAGHWAQNTADVELCSVVFFQLQYILTKRYSSNIACIHNPVWNRMCCMRFVPRLRKKLHWSQLTSSLNVLTYMSFEVFILCAGINHKIICDRAHHLQILLCLISDPK